MKIPQVPFEMKAHPGTMEKLNHLGIAQGKERFEVSKLHAGDIGVVAKLRHSHTNDTLSAAGRPVTLTPIEFPAAEIALAVKGKTRSDEDKLGEVLPKLHEEVQFRAHSKFCHLRDF